MVEKDIASGRVSESVTGGVNNAYQQRWNSYKRVCFEKKIAVEANEDIYLYYAKRYRLASQITPKAGSTTLIAMFYMLNKRTDENVFMEARMDMHVESKNKIIQKTFKLGELEDMVVLLPTRDPYSRLYSAYVDKIYLADDVNFTQTVIKHAGSRGDLSKWWQYNATFQNFLDYALDESISKHVQDSHYNVIFRSKYCMLHNPVIIIKQESFSLDIEYALKTANVNDEDLNVIRNVLTSNRAESAASAIVKTELQKLNKRFRQNDVFKKGERQSDALQFVFKRLWSSFQIQGIISAHSVFPYAKFYSLNSEEIDTVLDIFLSEIKNRPLTSSERKEQRRRSMLDAYKHIDAGSIKKIQAKYKKDFLAFEYDPVLPL
ncbi:hypothetical protein ACF0H5_006229 [Mactra antiquata]